MCTIINLGYKGDNGGKQNPSKMSLLYALPVRRWGQLCIFARQWGHIWSILSLKAAGVVTSEQRHDIRGFVCNLWGTEPVAERALQHTHDPVAVLSARHRQLSLWGKVVSWRNRTCFIPRLKVKQSDSTPLLYLVLHSCCSKIQLCFFSVQFVYLTVSFHFLNIACICQKCVLARGLLSNCGFASTRKSNRPAGS